MLLPIVNDCAPAYSWARVGCLFDPLITHLISRNKEGNDEQNADENDVSVVQHIVLSWADLPPL